MFFYRRSYARRRLLPTIALIVARSGGASTVGCYSRIGKKLAERERECSRIVWRNERTRLADDLRHRIMVRADTWQARSHRLKKNDPERLVARRHHEDRCRPKNTRKRLIPSRTLDASQRPNAGLDLTCRHPSHDREPGGRKVSADDPKCFEKFHAPFALEIQADEYRVRRVVVPLACQQRFVEIASGS